MVFLDPDIPTRPQHLKYDVTGRRTGIIDIPMTTLGRPLVSRAIHSEQYGLKTQ